MRLHFKIYSLRKPTDVIPKPQIEISQNEKRKVFIFNLCFIKYIFIREYIILKYVVQY